METNLFDITYPDGTYVFSVDGETTYDSLRDIFKYKVARYIDENKVYFWGASDAIDTTKISLDKLATSDLKKNVLLALANDAIRIALKGKGLIGTKRAFYPSIRSSGNLRVDVLSGNTFVHDALEFHIQSETIDEGKISLLPTQVITPDGTNFNSPYSKQHSPSVRDKWTLLAYGAAYERWKEFLDSSIEYGASELGNLTVSIPESGGLSVEVGEQSEPKITFNAGADMTHNWPEGGLKQFGPLDYNLGDSKPDIKVALIAAGYSKPFSFNYLDLLNKGQGYYQAFETTFKAPLTLKENGRFERLEIISPELINSVQTIEDTGNLYQQALVNIRERNPHFDVVIVEIPQVLVDRFKGSSVDLRDYLKIIFLKQNVATQFLTEKTATGSNTAYTLSNFALGLYVSAGGKPWRIEEHPVDTAFLGISFGIKKQDGGRTKTLVGVAEITDEYGMSLGIRAVGETYEPGRGNHLTTDGIKSLIESLLAQYKSVYGNYPSRVIVHKTTSYNDDEATIQDSFREKNIDVVLLHVYKTDIRFNEDDDKKIKRGMHWQIDSNTSLLYTDGYVSYMNRSLTAWVPTPFVIRKFSGDENIATLTRQVLCLTKLNWNSTRNHENYPVTLSHSQKVIDLLRAGLDKNSIIDDFRYYF